MRLVLVMVGLPARGKSWVARKVARYLAWTGLRTRVFNVGDRRRALVGARQPHDFFDPDNAAGLAARQRAADEALAELLLWLEDGGVALYDATNTTRARRDRVARRCREAGATVAFVELACEDPAIVERNIRETKLLSPDYAGMAADAAVADFRRRIAHYERVYQPVAEGEGPRVRMVDAGRRVELTDVHEALPQALVGFLTCLRDAPRPIWLTRHGESAFNALGRIGGDAPLSPAGVVYAARLADTFATRPGPTVWTSTKRRVRETAAAIGLPSTPLRALDEIDAGVCDGLTYAEIKARLPAEYAQRKADKLRYRYPGGESYLDVIDRLNPLVLELERTSGPLLIVSHQAVLRALLAYFLAEPLERAPFLEVPLHSVLTLTPVGHGYALDITPLGPGVRGGPSS